MNLEKDEGDRFPWGNLKLEYIGGRIQKGFIKEDSLGGVHLEKPFDQVRSNEPA